MRVETNSKPASALPVAIDVILANLARSYDANNQLAGLRAGAHGVYVYINKSSHFFLPAEKLALFAANAISSSFISIEAALSTQVLPILREQPSWLLELAEGLSWNHALLLAEEVKGLASLEEFKQSYPQNAQFYLVGADGLLSLSDSMLK